MNVIMSILTGKGKKKILKNLIMPFVDLVAYLLKDVMLEVFTENV